MACLRLARLALRAPYAVVVVEDFSLSPSVDAVSVGVVDDGVTGVSGGDVTDTPHPSSTDDAVVVVVSLFAGPDVSAPNSGVNDASGGG